MQTSSQDDLTTLNERFDTAAPQDILRWSARQYGDRAAVVTSFGPTGIVTLHMLHEMGVSLPVITIDTGLLFDETHALIDEVKARFGLDLWRITPQQTVREQAVSEGDALWERQPNHCCALRKVEPLKRALRDKAAWLTGLRRDQSYRRAGTPILQVDARHDAIKIAPLATWTERMVWTYIEAHNLPYNPLHDEGYPSIGCVPCTGATGSRKGAYDRSGRWQGMSKEECGIHAAD